MTLNHLGVLARRLRLQLNADAVQKLGHLLATEACLSVGDQHFHGSEVPDPVRHDRFNEVLRLPAF